MKKILLIRHGATAGNLEKRYIGSRSDEPLCEIGVAQIEKLREQNLHADIVFSSPMRRARETAQLLFPQQNPMEVENFRETDFGIFEGKTAAELAENAAYQSWVDSFCTGPIPEGESVEAFKARCCKAFQEAASAVPEEKTAAFVVHGGVIMAILERFARPQRSFYDYYIGNGGCVSCSLENGILTIV